MVKYCDLFWSFFKVGTFTVGGGYAMLPLMQRELVDRHAWMDESEFLDCVALSQALPGVFAVNMAAMTGYRLRHTRGAAVAIVGNIMMPILFILLLAIFFRAFRDNVYVDRIFMGLRPAVVALIAAPVFVLWKNEWKRGKEEKWKSHSATLSLCHSAIFVIVPVLSALLIWLLGVSPVLVVLVAALAGYIYSQFITHNS